MNEDIENRVKEYVRRYELKEETLSAYAVETRAFIMLCKLVLEQRERVGELERMLGARE